MLISVFLENRPASGSDEQPRPVSVTQTAECCPLSASGVFLFFLPIEAVLPAVIWAITPEVVLVLSPGQQGFCDLDPLQGDELALNFLQVESFLLDSLCPCPLRSVPFEPHL